ncbi:MAG: hypothetical protein WC647_16100 [Desulfomonilaceae bacterium]
MSRAHLYLFSDASPSDWMVKGNDEAWRTVVNLVFQSDPDLQEEVDSGKNHFEVLSQDQLYTDFMTDFLSHLPSGVLRKWNTRGGYKSRLCYALGMVQHKYKPIVSACSFQEKTLRASKAMLLESYNRNIGAGGGTGPEKMKDTKKRIQKSRFGANFRSHQEAQSSENQFLVLLFMAWFIAGQYTFYRKNMVTRGPQGFDPLDLTIISDKLSGDDDSRRNHEQNLRKLIDPESGTARVTLTRSTLDVPYSGDILANNITGWLNAAISDPGGEFAQKAKAIDYKNVWAGWKILLGSVDKPQFIPALSRLTAIDNS